MRIYFLSGMGLHGQRKESVNLIGNDYCEDGTVGKGFWGAIFVALAKAHLQVLRVEAAIGFVLSLASSKSALTKELSVDS